LPINTEPEAYGLHSNATIAKDIIDVMRDLDIILSCSTYSGSNRSSDLDATIFELTESILKELPDVYNV